MNCRKDRVGDRYGRLVIKRAYFKKVSGKWFHQYLCDCGNEKMLCGAEVRRGKSRSCGCYRSEQRTSHGLSGSPEYAVWNAMIQRCEKKNYSAYENYGGRGITVCSRWHRFENFINDMGMRPSKSHTIERVDNDKGYSPENCIWADRVAQCINQRIRKDNKTGFKGVSYNERARKYYVKICVLGKQYHLGCYDKIEDAINARIAGEKKHFNLNGE